MESTSASPAAPAAAGGWTNTKPTSTTNHPKVKHWWHRLTSHSSGNPDSQATAPSAMHQRTYTPRHAGRDARLAVPLADRKAAEGRANATKGNTAGEGLAVHPNQQVAMAKLKSYTSSRAARRAACGSRSASGSASMESIGESEDAEGEDADFGAPSLATVARLSKTTPARVCFSHQRFYSYASRMTGSKIEAAEAGVANLNADVTGASLSTSARSGVINDDDMSVSGYEVRRRLQTLRQEDVARKLQEQLNPTAGKGKGSVLEMPRSYPQPQLSLMPVTGSVAQNAQEGDTLSPTSPSNPKPDTKSILTTDTTKSHKAIRQTTFQFPSSPTRERNSSEDNSPLNTSADTSDAEWQNGSVDLDLSLNSSSTSFGGEQAEGEDKKDGVVVKERIIDDDWAQRVMEAAKAL